MLDLKLIRENPEMVRDAVASRNDTAPINDILRLDIERRKIANADRRHQQKLDGQPDLHLEGGSFAAGVHAAGLLQLPAVFLFNHPPAFSVDDEFRDAGNIGR